jgi:tetratricopeptide (TPR) repeat protein
MGNLHEAEEMRKAAAKVLRSQLFSNAPRMSLFLKFIVEEAISGRSDLIKESVIGVEVFGKDANYDPRADATVRTEAMKLRAKLQHYYEGEGRLDDVTISVPKGRYAPIFVRKQFDQGQHSTRNHTRRDAWAKFNAYLAVSLALGLVAWFVWARFVRGTTAAGRSGRTAETGRLLARGESFMRLGTGPDLWNATEYFKLAIVADASDARPHAALATAYLDLVENEAAQAAELIALAKTEAEIALRLNRGGAEAHYALAQVLLVSDYKWKAADQEFKRALSIDPSDVNTRYTYAHMCLMPRSLFSEAATDLREGLKYDPLSGSLNTELANAELRMGRIAAGLDRYRETLARYPDAPGTLTGLAASLLSLQRSNEALPLLLHAERVHPDDTWIASYTALGYVRLHQPSEAERILETLRRRRPAPDDSIAAVYAALGRKDQAFEHLNNSFANHSSKLLWLAVDRRFESLRGDKRFNELLARMHLIEQ